MLANNHAIPCEKQISKVNKHIVSFWMQRLVAERLESKTHYLKLIFQQTNKNWEQTLYIYLARYMGARVNKDPFETLATGLSFLTIQKNRNELQKIEALLFGQAGMLEANFEDTYFKTLKEEYTFLAKKYELNPMSGISWKFSRMRPVGFPTIRIAQFAHILYKNTRLFSKILEEENIKGIRKILKVKPSYYWHSHYRFGKESKYLEKNMGDRFVDQLIINVVCPILFLYGKHIANENYCERAIRFLEATTPEQNNIVRKYISLGVSCKSASDSQALIELNKEYCKEKQCVSCAIGNAIINTTS